jgi:methionyl-tRNA formyltransferase
VVAAFGQILPKEILEIPQYGCLNVHPSLLPKYRGPSPIQYTILNGDKETGVTIIKMTEEVDAGDIVASARHEVGSMKITSEELEKELANLGAKLLIETIPKWLKREIKPIPQDDSKATQTKVLEKEDGKIDWEKPAEHIERQIRAFQPWPSAYAECKMKNAKGKMLKILKADVLKQTKDGPFGQPGKTFLAPDDKIAVQTGKDFLIIKELQLEGKRKISSAEFLRGHADFIGTIL